MDNKTRTKHRTPTNDSSLSYRVCVWGGGGGGGLNAFTENTVSFHIAGYFSTSLNFVNLFIKVITMRAHIKLLDLLVCFHYILNATRI